MDLVYVKGPVCTAFFPVSKEGEVAWKVIAENSAMYSGAPTS